ncbi:Family 51 glycoside hydrolase [Stemphylium lycopersici]|uniref:Family 51 glycoside hydrolase n=1 Tax=Stemphylium lycopersici TaxID=183478 RepID=A0A364N1J2_STELY|nr:Family 51 glycoside hydrolase [Stemphylium lycopersici]
MPIRNPFRRAGPPEQVDETQRSAPENGFKSTAVSGATPLQVKDPAEYKLSVMMQWDSDGGNGHLERHWLTMRQPSPQNEKPTFWHSKSNVSTTSSNHRSLLSETEPFNISRESFDSYRRSFDISARSPIVDNVHETYPRQSLDARRSVETRRSFDVRRSRATPRSSMQQGRPSESHDEVPEEGFEDVGLNDEPKPQPKKRSIFSRFGDNNNNNTTNSHANDKPEERPASSHHFSLTGRKRAESGAGSELKPMPKPTPEAAVELR